MLARKTYTPEEIGQARASLARQLTTYRALTEAVQDSPAEAALAAFAAEFFNNLLIALDRPFVHRIRSAAGKDGNPLNEVEMLVEALVNNQGVLEPSTVLKLVPEQSVAKVAFGAQIRLTQDQFEGLATAFFAELEARFR